MHYIRPWKLSVEGDAWPERGFSLDGIIHRLICQDMSENGPSYPGCLPSA